MSKSRRSSADPASGQEHPQRLRGVARVDRPASGAYGWVASIYRGGTRKGRFFSDSKHGGSEGSRSAAIAQFAEWDAELPPPQRFHTRAGRRSVTGIVGVTEGTEGYQADGAPHRVFAASWSDNGREHVIRFRWAIYGKARALKLATKARELRVKDRAVLESMVPGVKKYQPKGPLGGRARVARPVSTP